ncbi:hypothetical protein MMC07_005753 [Pseudocyphellaria aurata]|nr:hypothetical protein [Pseudocyphellaria aurata]
MSFGRYNDRVPIVVGRTTRSLHPETIACYIPGYFDLLNYYEHPLHDPHADRITCKALNHLFDYLEEIDHGCHTPTAFYDRLNTPWGRVRHGPNEDRALFVALGRILDEDFLQCNDTLQSDMSSYVIRHCADIIRGQVDGWIDYVNALERIGIHETEMAQVLSYIIDEHRKRRVPFLHHGSSSRLSEDVLELLDELMAIEEERHARAGQLCTRCHHRRALELEDRRLIHIPKHHGHHGVFGRRPTCRDCVRHKQPWLQKFYNPPVLEASPDVFLLGNESDNFSNPDSVLGGGSPRRRRVR